MSENRPTANLTDLFTQGVIPEPPKQLSQEEKEQLADAGTPFVIHSIAYGDDGEFDPYFEFSVTLEGKPATFRLSSNKNRDPLVQALADATATQDVAGVRLRAIGTRGGNKFITIDQA